MGLGLAGGYGAAAGGDMLYRMVQDRLKQQLLDAESRQRQQQIDQQGAYQQGQLSIADRNAASLEADRQEKVKAAQDERQRVADFYKMLQPEVTGAAAATGGGGMAGVPDIPVLRTLTTGQKLDNPTPALRMGAVQAGIDPNKVFGTVKEDKPGTKPVYTRTRNGKLRYEQDVESNAVINAEPAPTAAGAGGQQSALDPEGVEYAATQYRVTGQMPSLGMGNSAARAAIINAAAKQAKALSLTPAQAIQKQAAYKADAQALNRMRVLGSAAEAFENKALAQADIVQEYSRQVQRTEWPIINKAVVNMQVQTGNTPAQLLVNSILTFSNEYAKIMEGSTASAQASTDAARRTAEKLVNAALNPTTLQKTVDLMKREMALTIEGYNATVAHITDRMGGAAPQQPTTGEGVLSADELMKKYGGGRGGQ